jgi:D-alanine transaminase
MSRVAYVNGQYVTARPATVHIEDRGHQFADGVYEVWSVLRRSSGRFRRPHDRLHRSLNELRIDIPMSARRLTQVLKETVRRNRVRTASSICRSRAAPRAATIRSRPRARRPAW